ASATVGIVGFGLVGRAIAERLAGFQCRLLAYDQSVSVALAASWPSVTMTSLEDVMARSDYVVLALPLTDDTRHLINSRTIAAIARRQAGQSCTRIAGRRERGGGCHRTRA